MYRSRTLVITICCLSFWAITVPTASSQSGNGKTGCGIGNYITIEGVEDHTGTKSSGNFKVDTVNGKKLETPLLMQVDGNIFTGAKRYVFKGYESFGLLGIPPAINEARKEEGKPPLMNEKDFQVNYHFVVLLVVSPKDVKVNSTDSLPKGITGNPIGSYITIEGVEDNSTGIKSFLNFKADTVNGKRLEKPLFMQVSQNRLTGAKRYVFKGYETLQQYGSPPAINQARKEAGQQPFAEPGAGFQIQFYFEVLSVVPPKDIKAIPQAGR